MSARRSRTKIHNGEKVVCYFEYGLDEINFYVAYCSGVLIRYESVQGLGNCEGSIKLLKLYYKLLDMDISGIERLLKVKISSDGITDKKGNRTTETIVL